MAQFADLQSPYQRAQALLLNLPSPYPTGRPPRLQQRRRRRAPSVALGALTPDQAAQQIFPLSAITKTAGHTQAVYNTILASVQAGQMLDATGNPAYIPGTQDCSATGVNSDLKLAQTSAGLALTGTTIGLTAAGVVTGAALAPFTMGISAIIGLFPLIFGHHAAAVKKEQSVLCAAVPAANNYLNIIDQAVNSGQATPQQGQAALSSLASDFTSQVSSIVKGSGPASTGDCNAACVMIAELNAIVAYKTSVYQDMIAATPAAVVSLPGAAAVSSAVQKVSSSTGIPSWLILLGGAVLLYELL